MGNSKRNFLLVFCLILAGCGEPNQSSVSPAETAATEPSTILDAPLSETSRLNTWLDEQYEEQLDFSPQARTRLGEKTDNHLLDEVTDEASDIEMDWLRQSVASMREEFDYELLNEDGKLSFDMWEYSLDQAERYIPFRRHGYVFGRGGPQTFVPSFLLSFHTVDTEADLAAYVSRLEQIDRVLLDYLNLAQLSAVEGIRPPRFSYDFALTEIERVTSGVPFNNSDDTPNSPIWVDFQDKAESLFENDTIDSDQLQDYLEQARGILSGEVLLAYQQIQSWLEEDIVNTDEEPQGVWSLPDGQDFYTQRLSRMTTLDLTAQEIHDIGLAEVERLQAAMESIRQQVEFDGTLQEFFVFMREDDQFYYPNTDEGRQEFLDVNNQYLDAITEKLPEYFGRLPKAALEVRRVEAFREQPGAAQHYRSGSPDGSRPGVFYAHMSDMSTLAIYQIEDIAYHEGNPGHHMQISIQQELTDVPRFRTQYRTTAYTEGWGLYAEWLGKEMGGVEDPYSDFGRLSGEIWRAVRLVVDTGMHSLGWTEDQSVQYFLDNSPIPEGAVRSEVQRYFTGAGQATAYKIGMMNFQQARANAEEALGDKFDVRAFHDVVLGAGAVPMPMMHARVERWVQEQL